MSTISAVRYPWPGTGGVSLTGPPAADSSSVETMGFEPTTPCLQSAPAQTHDQVIYALTQVRAFRQERPER